MNDRWHAYHADLINLEKVRIPRWTGQNKENIGVKLHGFADAPNRAYAAVVHLRVIHSFESVQLSFLAAKTKVAPLKTYPDSSLMLLFSFVDSSNGRHSLDLDQAAIYGWTDSTITLAWLRQHPSKWSTYVANRISEVQTSLPTIR